MKKGFRSRVHRWLYSLADKETLEKGTQRVHGGATDKFNKLSSLILKAAAIFSKHLEE